MELKFRVFCEHTDRMIDWEYIHRVGILHKMINSPFKVVLQFTGLQDINGKDIYEGDIVIPYSLENKMNKSVIVYEFNEFRIKGESLYWNWDLKQIEVIGNIYVNPELL